MTKDELIEGVATAIIECEAGGDYEPKAVANAVINHLTPMMRELDCKYRWQT